jgi:hypothetical protein
LLRAAATNASSTTRSRYTLAAGEQVLQVPPVVQVALRQEGDVGGAARPVLVRVDAHRSGVVARRPSLRRRLATVARAAHW